MRAAIDADSWSEWKKLFFRIFSEFADGARVSAWRSKVFHTEDALV